MCTHNDDFSSTLYFYYMYIQLKNMINALFSSKLNGTKNFVLDGVEFGWSSVISLYERECERVKQV